MLRLPTMHINHAGRVDDELLNWTAGTLYMRTLCTMLRGQGNGNRALAHLHATHAIAPPKQAKEPILTSTDLD